jgi:hypothetical protein
VLTGHATFWMIVVVAFVDTSAAVLYRSGSGGAMKAVVPQPQLADASSVTMARMSSIRLVAPPLGGALFGLARGVPFVADAVSYAFSTASLLLMRTRFQEEREPGARTPFREGVTYFWSIPFLRATAGMIGASNLVAVGAPITVIILAHRHGLSSTAIGGFVAIQGVTLLAGSLLSPVLRRLFPMRAILLSEFWMALVYAAFLVYPNVYVLAAAASLHAFFPEHRLGDPGVLLCADPGQAARAGDGRRDHVAGGFGTARAARRGPVALPHIAAADDPRPHRAGGCRRAARDAEPGAARPA